MTKQAYRLTSAGARNRVLDAIRAAPDGWLVEIGEPKRSLDQNALLWVLLTKLSEARPQGREATPETWKVLCMHAAGHACQFEIGLDGRPFPVGFRSSRMSKSQMRDLIEWIYAYAAECGIDLEERHEPRNAQEGR